MNRGQAPVMKKQTVIIGGGPAGLMAAEALTSRGIAVDLYDAMPSLGRKFLMAGKSGLNLTHSEPLDDFLTRFGDRRLELEKSIHHFSPKAIRHWAEVLGTETFVGSSGRVFPKSMKAAPLLRAWLKRLRAAGMTVHVRHKWTGWDEAGHLTFLMPDGAVAVESSATILALGGASWPELGSDASWVPLLAGKGIVTAPFKPANCGFDVAWSDHMRTRFAGSPVKNVRLQVGVQSVKGEFVITETGIEGSAVYTLSAELRDALERGEGTLSLDLTPDRSLADLQKRLGKAQGSRSLSTHLKRTVNIAGVKAALLREGAGDTDLSDPGAVAALLKNLPVHLERPRPISEAISSAGGIPLEALDAHGMLSQKPGTFCAGEMLDWEAPTGGYLLTACMAQGRWVGEAVADWLERGARN